MIQEKTRPISDAERAKLEPEIRDVRFNSAGVLVGAIVLGVPGLGLVALVAALFVNRALLPSPVALFTLAAITGAIGVALLFKAAARVLSLIRPLAPLRRARDLRGALVREISIDVACAWWSDLIVDGVVLFVRDDGGAMLFLRGDTLSDQVKNPDSRSPRLRIGRRTRIVVFDDELVDVRFEGEGVHAAVISDPDIDELERVWMSEAFRVLDEADLDERLRGVLA
ncbi:MAG: hypothetical protein SFY96_08865 [Planctomycetota bacterium]|nr:hypothetical protein [Planctomycetota bacterium]